jgi:hypothetical protein
VTKADVAELVDARDLKFFALVESPHLFCITRPKITIETDGTRRDLHNGGYPVAIVDHNYYDGRIKALPTVVSGQRHVDRRPHLKRHRQPTQRHRATRDGALLHVRSQTLATKQPRLALHAGLVP